MHLQVTDLACKELAPLVEFVDHMMQNLHIDGLAAEFKCLSTIMHCDSQPAASTKQAVNCVRSATASTDYQLLPSFEGLQLGKQILEIADSRANERSVTHKHLEQIATVTELCDRLNALHKNDNTKIYKPDALDDIVKAVELLGDSEPKLQKSTEKGP